ncbi:hypothetical protein ZWY2020_025867 [Hordeum vulgare]|nr:hypothetical protein ZWY2020_025867 [Hordeum vulgare]
MFHLVVRRYFGYTCPESGLDKTRDLVLDGLLHTEQDYERAFQVIEAELAFVYDFFFTKYASIMYGNEVRSKHMHRLKKLLPSREAGKAVELPMEVKRAVARTIKNSTNGYLSHGTSALMRHGMSDLLHGACKITDEYTLTHSILVWHVATSFCEISDTIRRPDDVHPNQVVATILSKYCTYLVAFEPALLPGSAPEIKCALDEVVKEANEMLHGLASPREKYEKLSELQYVGDGRMLFITYGVMLGKALERMQNHANRWDLLADFWAEMMVYIAPSNNVDRHIELLAEGGEFVTHVWALLMHAGILERPSTAVP